MRLIRCYRRQYFAARVPHVYTDTFRHCHTHIHQFIIWSSNLSVKAIIIGVHTPGVTTSSSGCTDLFYILTSPNVDLSARFSTAMRTPGNDSLSSRRGDMSTNQYLALQRACHQQLASSTRPSPQSLSLKSTAPRIHLITNIVCKCETTWCIAGVRRNYDKRLEWGVPVQYTS